MYIHVRVTPGAKKEEFSVISENRFKISVKEKAEQNLANRRVIELVAKHFRKPLNHVRIINGHRSPSKILSVG